MLEEVSESIFLDLISSRAFLTCPVTPNWLVWMNLMHVEKSKKQCSIIILKYDNHSVFETFIALGPLGPSPTSNSTESPSLISPST